MKRVIALAAIAALSGCMTGPTPVDVTRFSLGPVSERGSVAVEPAPGAPTSMDYSLHASAVARELGRLGFSPGSQIGQSLYVAILDVRSDMRERVGGGSPVSIGIGGGTGGFRSGVGGGISFGLGGNRGGSVTATQTFVQLKRRADGSVVWEGRARGEAGGRDADVLADRMASALFRDFPGESGRTISVR